MKHKRKKFDEKVLLKRLCNKTIEEIENSLELEDELELLNVNDENLDKENENESEDNQ